MTGSDVLDIEWTDAQRAVYEEDGFLVVDRIIAPAFADTLRPRYSPIFAGKFETGTTPDHFPILWSWDGYCTAAMDEYMRLGSGASIAA